MGGSLCRSLSIASGGGCTWDIRRSVKFKFPFSIIKENCFEESSDRKGELCCWFSALGEFFRNIFVYVHRSRNPSFALQSPSSECKIVEKWIFKEKIFRVSWVEIPMKLEDANQCSISEKILEHRLSPFEETKSKFNETWGKKLPEKCLVVHNFLLILTKSKPKIFSLSSMFYLDFETFLIWLLSLQ